jgi:signal transduction histidine kinase
MLLSALLGAVTSWLLARNFLKPLSELRATTARLTAGDFSVRVGGNVTRRSDEIGDLSVAFNGMAERLAELIGAQKRLLADVSHEIRSPLQRMEMALALARGAEEHELESCLSRLETEVGRIDAMVEELLLLTRAEARLVSNDEEIVLEGLLSGLAEDIRFEAQEECPKIKVDAAANLAVRGNSVLLERALRNILHNAVNYAPAGSISIRARELDGRFAEISISDQGKGLPADELEKIFLPWYRVNSFVDGKAKPQEGMGLGLNISRRIAESLGGAISAANNSDGGLTVTILLPLSDGNT